MSEQPQDKSMTLADVGARLREEREKKGYSIDDVAGELKISARVVKGIEDADTKSLPHAAYVRGFIRSYGNYLGFSADDVNTFTGVLSDGLASEFATNSAISHSQEPSRRGKSKVWAIGLFVLCVLAVVFYWGSRDASLFSDATLQRLATSLPIPVPQREVAEPILPPAGAASVPDKNAPAVSGNKGSSEVSAGATAGSAKDSAGKASTAADKNATAAQGSGGATRAINNEAAAPTATQSEARTTENEPAVQEQPTPARADAVTIEEAARKAAAAAEGQHKIIITALDECWIHSNADATDTRQFSLRKGDTFALTFGKKLELKLGNAGGVRLRYNGHDMPPAGKDGQVKTLVFPPSAS